MNNRTHYNGLDSGYGNATLLAHPELCTLETCDLSMAAFNYLPTIPGNSLYTAIFGCLLLGQIALGVKYRTWGYMVAMIIGLSLEVAGYIPRILLHNSPFNNDYFLLYLSCVTLAPAFMTAAIYLMLARIISVYGEHLSRFKPKTYTLVFCFFDFISLVLQASGAFVAVAADTIPELELGRKLMLSGLSWQIVSLVVFLSLCVEIAICVRRSPATWNATYLPLVTSVNFKLFLSALTLACVTIFIRCVYRCVELSGGFFGELFVDDEPLFMVLEGVMIILAALGLTVFHPGWVFGQAWHDATFSFRTRQPWWLSTSSDAEYLNDKDAHVSTIGDISWPKERDTELSREPTWVQEWV